MSRTERYLIILALFLLLLVGLVPGSLLVYELLGGEITFGQMPPTAVSNLPDAPQNTDADTGQPQPQPQPTPVISTSIILTQTPEPVVLEPTPTSTRVIQPTIEPTPTATKVVPDTVEPTIPTPTNTPIAPTSTSTVVAEPTLTPTLTPWPTPTPAPTVVEPTPTTPVEVVIPPTATPVLAPVNWNSARGIGGTDSAGVLNFDLHYNWSLSPPYNSAAAAANPKWVRTVPCVDTNDEVMSPTIAQIQAAAQYDVANQYRNRTWLIYNEPHYAQGPCGSANDQRMRRNPDYAATKFIEIAKAVKDIDSSARLFAGGITVIYYPDTQAWWYSFLDTLAATSVPGYGTGVDLLDGVHVHIYPDPKADCNLPGKRDCASRVAEIANGWYHNHHNADARTRGLPIWITETGWLDCNGSYLGGSLQEKQTWIRDNYMIPIAQWYVGDPNWPYDPEIPTNPGYEVMFWFHTFWSNENKFSCTFLLANANGQLSPLGQYWNGVVQ